MALSSAAAGLPTQLLTDSARPVGIGHSLFGSLAAVLSSSSMTARVTVAGRKLAGDGGGRKVLLDRVSFGMPEKCLVGGSARAARASRRSSAR